MLLQGDRTAEDWQAVSVVRRAIDGIEHPAVFGGLFRLAALELFAKDGVIRETLGNHRAKSPLDRDVDVRDEIDGALLVDAEIRGAEVFHLHAARVHRRLDCRCEEDWWDGVRHRWQPVS